MRETILVNKYRFLVILPFVYLETFLLPDSYNVLGN